MRPSEADLEYHDSNEPKSEASFHDILGMMVKQIGFLQSDDNSYLKKRAETLRDIGRQMRGFRKMSGVSLRELSRRTGCSARMLSDMELGRKVYSIEWARKALHSLLNVQGHAPLAESERGQQGKGCNHG